MQENPILAQDPYSLFIYALKAPETKRKYVGHLITFFDFVDGSPERQPNVRRRKTTEELMNLQQKAYSFVEKARKDKNWAFLRVLEFLQFQKDRIERKEIVAGTLKNYSKAIRLFCEMSEIEIPWKRITRGLPRPKRYASDRVPTIEEVKKLVAYPDRRIKAIVYTMISSGIRLQAWDYIRWSQIQPIERDGKVVAAKMTVYAGEPEEYFCFITPSAYHELATWMKYREECGEEISGDSWVMRNLWDVTTLPHDNNRDDDGMKSGIGKGVVSAPNKLQSQGIKRLIMRALYAQGLRGTLPKDKKRHEFQGVHSLRKICQTQLEIAGVRNVNIQTLMGRSIGVNDSYYRVTVSDLLSDYEKAIPLLSIDESYNLHEQLN